jgi:pimeloyl-ACP methyl ester carboxylesterase
VRWLASLAAAICVLAPQAAVAQTAAGDWVGMITIGPGRTLREVVHIRKRADGGYTGAFDSVDRGSYGRGLTDVVATGDTLSFTTADEPKGAYAAKWDAASGRWIGQWTQSGQTFPLTLAAGPPPALPAVAGLDGAWDGTLNVGAIQLRLVLHVRTGADGTAAWLDSIDQMSNGLDVTSLHRDGAHVGFEMPVLKVVFDGALSADQQSIAGTFTQGGVPLPLTFTKRAPGVAAPTMNRPQTPKKPYPYREETVTFDDAAAHVSLAGTLTLPTGNGPFPAVVLVAGSGPNTRDEAVAGHQIFLVLSDYLTRHGIAVLRYDKRGIGQSTGDYAKATTMDFADDADAAAAYLRGRPEIDPRRVGLIGHSEGGAISPIVAAGDPKIAFVVMMAGPGVDGADLLIEQSRLIAKAAGMDDAKLAESGTLLKALIAIVRQERDPAVRKARLAEVVAHFAAAHAIPAASLQPQADAIDTPWFRYFFDYDPAPTLRQLRCPVLALNGSLDLQVPPEQNLPPIRAALAHDPDATIVELPGLNHLFQTAKTGSPGEYGQIEETIAPAALDTITGWILKRAGGPAAGS